MTREPILQQLESDTLDAILSLWHSWALADRGVRGFNRKALVVGDCRPWRLQHEGQQDQLDADIDNAQCRVVDFAVRQMDEPYRTAIYLEARNLCNGLAIWNSQRLPQNPLERAIVVKAARGFLTIRLQSSGVM